MHLKPEVIAGFLVFASFSFAAKVPNNPRCDPIPAGAFDREAHFVFWIDKLINSELLSRLRYLLKAISCEIPTSNKILSLVISYNAEHQVFGSPVTSDKIPNELYRDVENSEVTNSTACSRFLRALAGVPAPFLKHKNVQFIVPIFDDDKEPQCFLRAFQNQYKDFEKNENLYFNGILINSLLPIQSNQSIRVVIPDLVRAINLSRISLSASDVINEVHESAHLVQSYGSMMHDILNGNSVHDWEEITTTATASKSLLSTTPTATFPTIPRRIKTETLLKRETGPDDIQFFDEITEDDPVLKPRAIFADSNNTNTSTASSSTSLTSMKAASSFNKSSTVSTNLSTSSKNSSSSSTTPSIQPSTTVNNLTEAQTTSTTGNVSTTTGISETGSVPADLPPTTTVQEYDAVVAKDSGRLAMMKGVKNATNEKNNRTSTISGLAGSEEDDKFNRTIDVDMFIYILIPLLIIWLLCIFLCLLWMYYCAKEKKKKLESQSQQELLALLEKCPSGEEPSPQKLVSLKESDEVDDEWKKIKPPASTISSNPSNSELENVKQPPLIAQYAPVEVSEFEEKNDDLMENRPRHGGYVPRKKTADLRFD